MRSAVFSVLLVLLGTVSCSRLCSRVVATYNIQHGQSMERKEVNISRTAFEIADLRSDLIGIQEVDNGTHRSLVDEVAVMSKLSNMTGIFAPMRAFDGGMYGISVLSRFEILDSKIFRYHSNSSSSSRTPEECIVEKPSDYCQGAVAIKVRPCVDEGIEDAIWFVTTHFGNDNKGEVQEQEAVLLLENIESNLDTDITLLSGDLNSWPNTAAIKTLHHDMTDLWDTCGSGRGETFNSSVPVERIDYLMYKSKPCISSCLKISCSREKGSIPASTVSDHRPIVIPIVFSKE